MRNIDKIKRLEKEIGRYQKKVADQDKENTALRKRLQDFVAGNSEVNMQVDAILAQVSIIYGEDGKDPDTGEIIGRRLVLPLVDLRDVYSRYEVRARKDEAAQQYIIGVVPREAKAALKGGDEK